MPRRFDFISPGIQLRELDQSALTPVPEEDGLLIIGRSRRGPGMKPVRVNKLQDFYDTFGEPVAGKGAPDSDVWRNGNTQSPMYAMYAAQAYLASEVGPLTFVRLLGEENTKATAAGKAGWQIADTLALSSTATGHKSALGLFVISSGSIKSETFVSTGSLAAIFYSNGAEIALKGNAIGSASVGTNFTTQNARFLRSDPNAGQANTFSLVIEGQTHTINFDPTSKDYIRNVLNTNPQSIKGNNNFGQTNQKYFLGETFENAVKVNSTGSAGEQFGILLNLQVNSASPSTTENWAYHREDAKESKTGWFISQQPHQEELFRLCSLHSGEDFQNKYFAAVEDLVLGDNKKPSSFTIAIYEWGTDADSTRSGRSALESFSNLSLNPGSPNYISKIIGDRYLEWDSANKKFNTRGLYPNKSDYVRVEAAPSMENQVLKNDNSLPVGYKGPIRPKAFSLISGSTSIFDAITPSLGTASPTAITNAFVTGGLIPFRGFNEGGPAIFDTQIFMPATSDPQHFNLLTDLTASFEFPALQLTEQNFNAGNNYGHESLFGHDARVTSSTSYLDQSYKEVLRQLPGAFNSYIDAGAAMPSGFEHSYVFSLDDIVQQDAGTSGAGARAFFFKSGSFAESTSLPTNASVSKIASNGLKTLFTSTISGGVRQFSAPFFGGFDGLDILEANPFANDEIGTDELASYELNTINKALDIVRDPDFINYDLISIPGITKPAVTDELLKLVDERRDALAVIDLEGGHVPAYEGNGVKTAGSVDGTVSSLDGRAIDNSYAAAYYPWVYLQDTVHPSNPIFEAPPSVAAIGAIAASERASQPWFAPAGFNRGGLEQLGGPRGPKVNGTWETLTKAERDDLYSAKINPIANFTAAGGPVIFGQKTLQLQASALDRINVRRLMIFIKKRIGVIARDLLFDQAVDVTFARFNAQASAVLQSVKSNFGVTDFKIVLDETTTTPDLIDRNIMYAQIFIKPARAIEFIAIDFIISNTGVEFE